MERLRDYERPAGYDRKGYLEKVPSFAFDGNDLPTEFFGYRITRRFTHEFLGRIFTDPVSVFPEDMLNPNYRIPSIRRRLNNLVEAGKLVAQSISTMAQLKACPPLRALLEVMFHGNWEGKGLLDRRSVFRSAKILASDWYEERLKTRLSVTKKYWSERVDYLDNF